MDEAAMWLDTVATETAGVMPMKIRSGVIRKPPPIPNIPEMKPTASPMPSRRNMLAGISAMAWWYASRRESEEERASPGIDPLGSCQSTPSQKATVKYFFLSILSSAVLLYGFSFLYGTTGSTDLAAIRQE